MISMDEVAIVCECGWRVEMFIFKGQPWARGVYAPDSEKNMVALTDPATLVEVSPAFVRDQMLEFFGTWNQRVEAFTPRITCNCRRVYTDEQMLDLWRGDQTEP